MNAPLEVATTVITAETQPQQQSHQPGIGHLRRAQSTDSTGVRHYQCYMRGLEQTLTLLDPRVSSIHHKKTNRIILTTEFRESDNGERQLLQKSGPSAQALQSSQSSTATVIPQDRMDQAIFRARSSSARLSPIGTRHHLLSYAASPTSDLTQTNDILNDVPLLRPCDFKSVPFIRPSLSCPSTVFESPLFCNRHSSSPPKSIVGIDDASAAGIMMGMTGTAGVGTPLEGRQSSEQSENELDAVDVSAIEFEDGSSFHIEADEGIEKEEHQGSEESANESGDLPMRNLNNAFDLLVVHDERDCEALKLIRSGRRMSEINASLSKNYSHSDDNITQREAKKLSPSSVLGFEDASQKSNTTTVVEVGNGVTVPLITMPTFHLGSLLKGELSQGFINRVSFYSVVRDINKEAGDAAASDPKGSIYLGESSFDGIKRIDSNYSHTIRGSGGREVIAEDGKVHIHPDPEEESKSILVVSCIHECLPNSLQKTDSNLRTFYPAEMGTSLLDEEWWLLSAISSRTPEEIAANKASNLLPTFAEAMGERDDANNTGSKTQLWKPGRSWWEAKSGKNPWVEPIVHNNRWRYLWPLIHYHKFIAKCVKKLRRNGIDVKSSTTTVSVFLRQEVCHVSDHLAFMSKYDSEEWTTALRNFEGWTSHDPNVQEAIRNLVMSQRLQSMNLADVSSSLLQSQLEESVLKAMHAIKEEATKAAESETYDYCGKRGTVKNRPKSSPARNRTNCSTNAECSSQDSFLNDTLKYCSMPHVNTQIYKSWSNSITPGLLTNCQQVMTREGSWHEENNPSCHHQDMFGPQYDHHHSYGPIHAPGLYNHHYGTTMPHSYHHQPRYTGGLEMYSPHHQHVGYHFGGDMPYPNNQFEHSLYYNGYYHPELSCLDGIMVNNSIHPEVNLSYKNSSATASPNRYHDETHGQYHMSIFPHDYWGHTNFSHHPGVTPSPIMHTPSKPPRSNFNKQLQRRVSKGSHLQIDGKSKSLILYPKHTDSPASRFVMSPQDKTNPFYHAKNHQAASSLNQSGQEESFVLPSIEDFSRESPSRQVIGTKSLGHNVLTEIMPPAVKEIYIESRNEEAEGQFPKEN